MLKIIQVNIPFIDAIQQVPTYAKFLTDLITKKMKNSVSKKRLLTEQVSYVIQSKYLVKYKDPGDWKSSY